MKQPINYMPFEERTVDSQYSDLLLEIMRNGKDVPSIQGERAKRITSHLMKFNMSNGFPVITERDLRKTFKGALGEHIGFLNGARTIDELKNYGCPRVYWERWVTAEKCANFGLEAGDLGPGSYGPAWTKVPTPDGRFFNQIENIQNQIKKSPFIRTHRIDPWIPYFTASWNPDFPRKVVVAPCHGWIKVFVDEETKTLSIHHNQRSADVPVGLVGNMIQYAAFGLMLASILGYTFEELTYFIEDAHIYESQFTYVEELISRPTERFPTVRLNEQKERLEDFRKSSFDLYEDYLPGPEMMIPTPV